MNVLILNNPVKSNVTPSSRDTLKGIRPIL